MPAAAAGAKIEATRQEASAINLETAAKTTAMLPRHYACLSQTLPHMATGIPMIRL